ncbi:hypothetical protein [Streptomyces sp. NPDC054962]
MDRPAVWFNSPRTDCWGIPFTEEGVLGYAEHPGTPTAGRACLKPAWR